MVVVIANYLPPAVRGRMKLWFIEVKPNVFVSGIKNSVADSVIKYLYNHCPIRSGLIIFQKINKPPGYKIQEIGNTLKSIIHISGMQLVYENVKSDNIL